MKKLLLAILVILFIEFTFQQCANPGRPTGGPKDTIPPTLLSANPVSGTVNFKGETITLSFSEYVNADKLQQQLIITPKTDLTYKSIVKRNNLVIKFNQELQDSTTYNFNFADGVTDITEKNPVVNLSIAFSTGYFIDSMSVNGYVEDLLTQEPAAGFLVGLYPVTDTLDYFVDTPLYFTTADDSGRYEMNYLKEGSYRILSFNDENSNLTFDPDIEPHAFVSEPIVLDSVMQIPDMRVVLQNVKPLALINTRPTGPYVEIRFNKQIDQYTIKPDVYRHNVIGEKNDIIRVYKTESLNYSDSLVAYLNASDSLGNSVVDTLKFKFIESNRKPAGFSYTVNKSETKPSFDSLSIVANKPIDSLFTSLISISKDTLASIAPTVSYSLNENNTIANITYRYSKELLDSLTLHELPDSIKLDTLGNVIPDLLEKYSTKLVFDDAFLVSVENDSSTTKSVTIKEPIKRTGGKLNLRVSTSYQSYTVQLLNDQGQIKYVQKNSASMIFDQIEPATYSLRVLIDLNNDGKWSYGNLLNDEAPEPIYLNPENISVRENWEIDVDISF